MNTNYEDNWPLFEKALGYLRYLRIKKYIKPRGELTCVDIGCGFNGRFLRSIKHQIKKGYGIDIRANEMVYDNVQVINNSRWGGVKYHLRTSP